MTTTAETSKIPTHPKTIAEFLALIDGANMFDVYRSAGHDADYRLWFDDKENDTRTIIDLRVYTHALTAIETQRLHGWNASRDSWTTQGRKERTTIENRRGRKHLKTVVDAFFESHSSYRTTGYPARFNAYHRDGRWLIY